MKRDAAYWRNLFRIYIFITLVAVLFSAGLIFHGLNNVTKISSWFLFACVLFFNWGVYEFGVAVRHHRKLSLEAEQNSKKL